MSAIKTKNVTKKMTVKETPVKKTTTKEVSVSQQPVVETQEVPVPEVKAPVVQEPVVSSDTSVSQQQSVNTVTDESNSIKNRLEQLIKSKQDQLLEIKKEILELKKLQKDYETEMKNMSKTKKTKKVLSDNPNRKPSGFASPVIVSDELYEFLGKFGVKKGAPIARTDVTRYVTGYISDNKLQNPEFRREIIPDDALKVLFKEPIELKDKNDKNSPLIYTYLQLQKYLSPHFPKKNVAPVA